MKAIVQKLVPGKHGSYAVALSDSLSGSITFSLKDAWKEQQLPVEGSAVFLEDVQAKRAGWRATSARFFRPDDEKRAKSKDGIYFIVPSGMQFPFDFVGSQIVNELRKRNWNVPGINVEFDVWGTGAGKCRRVSYISGDDFRIYYGLRTERSMTGRKMITSPTNIVIPYLDLRVYEDESGPTLYTYVGKDWEADKKKFINGIKVHSKMDRKPRTYLHYSGGWKRPDEKGFQYTRESLRSPYLVHDNDLGREYDPQGSEPRFFRTEKIFTRVTKWLEENILSKILEIPVAEVIEDIFVPEPVIPFPNISLNLFTFCSCESAERIKKGKENSFELKESERYALTQNLRLVEWGVPDDGTFSKMAYDGFQWVGMQAEPINPQKPMKEFEIPGYYQGTFDYFVLQMKPNRANEVYVVDYGRGAEYRDEIFRQNPKKDTLTNGEYHELKRVIARTMIPITEYKFNYIKPTIVIRREIDLDEVEIISGPHSRY